MTKIKGHIYKVTNKINSKIYIGLTTHEVGERWKDHIKSMHSKNKEHRALYKAFEKYGINNFTIEEIEAVPLEELNEREIYWIDYYNSYHNGYNLTRGGEGRLLYCHEDFEKDFKNGIQIKDIAKKYNCDRETVSSYLHDIGVDTRQNSTKRRSLPVFQYTMQGEFIRQFPSMSEAARFLIQTENINSSIKGIVDHISAATRGKRASAYKYIWRLD